MNRAALSNRSKGDDHWLRAERERALYRSFQAKDELAFKEYLKDFPEFIERNFYRRNSQNLGVHEILSVNVHEFLSNYFQCFKDDPAYWGYDNTWVVELPLKSQKLSDFMINSLLENKAKKIQERQ